MIITLSFSWTGERLEWQ